MKKVPPLLFDSLIRLTFCRFSFLNSHVFPSCSTTNASLLKVWSHPSLNVDLHPHTQCLPPSSLFLSSSFPLPAYPLPLFLSFLSLLLSIYPSPSSLCLSLSPTDSSDSDLELSTVRHQPEGLDQLQAQTKFTRKELQSLYRGFKNVRPSAQTSFFALTQLQCFI